MAALSHEQYSRLESSVTHGRRISVLRRGTEFVVVPTALLLNGRREVLAATHPSTGDSITIYLDEIDHFEVIG